MYLVTGGAIHRITCRGGARAARRTGAHLRRFSSGKRANLRDFADRAEVFEGDLRDLEGRCGARRRVSACITRRRCASGAAFGGQPARYQRRQHHGTLQLLMACRDAGVKRGLRHRRRRSTVPMRRFPSVRTRSCCRSRRTPPPRKLAGEHYCRIFHASVRARDRQPPLFQRLSGRVRTLIRNTPRSCRSSFSRALDGVALTVHGDGLQSRTLTLHRQRGAGESARDGRARVVGGEAFNRVGRYAHGHRPASSARESAARSRVSTRRRAHATFVTHPGRHQRRAPARLRALDRSTMGWRARSRISGDSTNASARRPLERAPARERNTPRRS
jgi:hypothetical protein